MDRKEIKNRKGLKMVVLVEEIENQKGLVFLMHGFGSFKEHPLLVEVAKIFNENNFTTVRFDTTNSIGEGGGKMENGTVTGYCEDLEDEIGLSRPDSWYQEPFILIGHSLGGYCVAAYAAKNINKVKGLILISPFISGKLFQETDEIRPILDEWRKKGIREWESSSSPGVIKRLKYDFIEDGLNYDLLEYADRIKCPILLISGEKDITVPLEYQKLLFEKLKTKKEHFVVKDGDHNLKNKEKSQELYNIISSWIRNYIFSNRGSDFKI